MITGIPESGRTATVMKVLGILLLFGLAAIATSFQERWERERDEVVSLFMKGMEQAGPLRIALGMPDAYELDDEENDIKKELGNKLREHLNKILEKLKEKVEKGKEIHQDLLDKAREFIDKLKDIKEKVGDKAKTLLEKLKEKMKDLFKDMLDDNQDQEFSEALEAAENEFDTKEILNKLKEMIAKHFDVEKIREYLEKFKNTKIGQILLEKLQKLKESEVLQKLLDYIRKIMGKEDRESRSLKEYWEKVKEYFREKKIQMKEKYLEFAEWLKEAIRKGLDVAKDKVTTMKNIAREIIDHSKKIRKEVAMEALDALKPYKEDLGDLWNQLKDSVNEIIHRKD